MSLLIKALHKAEQEKTSEEKSTASVGVSSLELAPMEPDHATEAVLPASESVKPGRSGESGPDHHKAAGVVFAAKSRADNSSTKTLLLTGVVLLILVAGAFYYYLESLKQPEVVMPARVVQVAPNPDAAETPAAPEGTLLATEELAADAATADLLIAEAGGTEAEQEKPPVNTGFSLSPSSAKTGLVPEPAVVGAPVAKPEEVGVKVTRNNPPPAINPNLTTAYEAFNAGDDMTAQAAYRRVLQADVRNTDALLGMAAVALRQGRGNDAMGWYGKVLEIEPRNSFAQSAMASLRGRVDPVSSESRIKNLIAVQPDAAHLHAALGGLYADHSQWPQAQQAYFEAHRLDAANAEHAFNLAVSLDQLGKATLALQYYRQALSLLGNNSVAAIDRTALESRIAQLQ